MFERIEVTTAELATFVDDMLDDITLADFVILVDAITVEVFILEAIIVEDIMSVDATWFDAASSKPPIPAAARALRVEMIMAIPRMLDFDLNECSVVKS